MKRKWGNYWLDLIDFEKYVKSFIEQSIKIFVGKRYSSPSKLKLMMNEAIKDAIDELSKQDKIIINVDYGVTIDYQDDILKSFVVTYVYCN